VSPCLTPATFLKKISYRIKFSNVFLSFPSIDLSGNKYALVTNKIEHFCVNEHKKRQIYFITRSRDEKIKTEIKITVTNKLFSSTFIGR
jgi:hypothetical protein